MGVLNCGECDVPTPKMISAIFLFPFVFLAPPLAERGPDRIKKDTIRQSNDIKVFYALQ
jgi:hypothetical protein